MRASIVDLRYKMKDVLGALDRNETVTILFHGKEKGIISPINRKADTKVTEHPFFNMYREDQKQESVETVMEKLRGKRYQ